MPRRFGLLTLCCLFLCSCSTPYPKLDHCERLTGDAIERTFVDVVDSAIVKDLKNGRATNHWYANGRFTSEWTGRDSGGTVSGTWHVEDDQRCVVVTSGSPETIPHKTCSPLYQCDDRIVSINADGSIHGIHRLHQR